MGVAMPSLRTYFIPALYGVAGAILANTLIILLLLLLSLGTTVADIAMIWLITLPVPLVLGCWLACSPEAMAGPLYWQSLV